MRGRKLGEDKYTTLLTVVWEVQLPNTNIQSQGVRISNSLINLMSTSKELEYSNSLVQAFNINK